MNKNVLIVCTNGDSPITGFAVRVWSIAQTLQNNGYSVTLLRLYPAFKAQGSWQETAKNKNLKLIEVPMPPTARYSILRKIAHMLGNIVVHFLAYIKNIQIIQAEAHDAGGVVLLNRWTSIPVVVDFHGAASEEAKSRNQLLGRSSTAYKWLDKVEIRCIEKSDALFVVSETMIDHLKTKHNLKSLDKTHIVPVNVEDEFFTCAENEKIRNQLGIKIDEYLFVYSGGAQEYQCVDETLALFHKIKIKLPNSRLLILTGDKQVFVSAIDRIIPELKEEVILKSLKKNEVPEYLQAADMAFLLRRDNVLNTVSCPTKFGEYLACGVPVITTKFAGHAPSYVNNYKVGLIVSLEQKDDDIEKIISFIKYSDMDVKRKCVNIATKDLHWKKSETNIINCYSTIFD